MTPHGHGRIALNRQESAKRTRVVNISVSLDISRLLNSLYAGLLVGSTKGLRGV